MNVGSLFSGVGGLDEGLRRAGHEHVFFCEGGGDPNGTREERAQWAQGVYRRSVLEARFPGVPVYDDVRTLGESAWRAPADGAGAPVDNGGGQTEPGIPMRSDSPIDLICGGFPCQDVSVAGRRAGLAGDRTGLFFEAMRIVEAVRPGWVLLENVPGLLSSNGGRDFGVVLGTLADLGYGVAWRTLDSRFFGVPQRRRRVFILGAFADGDPRAAAERACEVLAVGEGCFRHLAPRGEAGPDVASTLGGSVGKGRGNDGNPFDRGGHSSLSGLGSGGPDDNDAQAGRLVVNLRGRDDGAQPELDDVASLRAAEGGSSRSYVIADTVRSHPRPGSNSDGLLTAFASKGGGGGAFHEDGVSPTLSAHGTEEGGQPPAIAFLPTGGGAKGLSISEDEAPGTGTGTGTGGTVAIAQEVGVRRLTPTECERLQGFPDGWTQLGDTPDSKRYSALGDAVTVNVAEWIGGRLAAA